MIEAGRGVVGFGGRVEVWAARQSLRGEARRGMAWSASPGPAWLVNQARPGRHGKVGHGLGGGARQGSNAWEAGQGPDWLGCARVAGPG